MLVSQRASGAQTSFWSLCPGGPPKFVAPNGVPVTKIYRGGKFMVQGPGPEPFTMEGMYQDTQTYEAWVNSLVT